MGGLAQRFDSPPTGVAVSSYNEPAGIFSPLIFMSRQLCCFLASDLPLCIHDVFTASGKEEWLLSSNSVCDVLDVYLEIV